MKKIIYTKHLRLRIQIRNFPENLPKEIFEKASEYFYDGITHHYIAIATVALADRVREFAVSFDIGESIELITIHPLKKEQRERRIATGRWRKLEEKKW